MNEKSKSIPMKPLYVHENKSSLLAVMPVMIKKGFVAIRIQHDTEKGTQKLSCKARISQIDKLDATAPIGTAILHAVDILSPEKCETAGYRTDDCGYARTLTAVVTDNEQIKISIACTLCSRDDEGHICSTGEYEHVEQIVISQTDMQQLKNAVKVAHNASLNETEVEQLPQKPTRKKAYSHYKGKGEQANGY